MKGRCNKHRRTTITLPVFRFMSGSRNNTVVPFNDATSKGVPLREFVELMLLGFSRGNPGVIQAYPDPTKTHTHTQGRGFSGLGCGFLGSVGSENPTGYRQWVSG